MMKLTIDKIYQILEFINANEKCSIELESGPIKISIVKDSERLSIHDKLEGEAEISNEEVVMPSEDKVATKENIAGLVPITADVTSVFYSKPSPDEAPFVKVGDIVQEDTCLCLLEIMKLYRQVTADVAGSIEKILVKDGDLVKAGTVMFLIKPLEKNSGS